MTQWQERWPTVVGKTELIVRVAQSADVPQPLREAMEYIAEAIDYKRCGLDDVSDVAIVLAIAALMEAKQ